MSEPTAIEAVLSKARSVAGDALRFEVYENDPLGFARDILGVQLWSKQEEILLATLHHWRIAIRSGHIVGKTFCMAILVLWWLYARKGLVVTTAPTWEHVEGVLWREINDRAHKARVPLPGVENQTERRVDNTWYAVGLSTNKSSAFQGRHHPRLLVVIDEASGVEEQIHTEISTLAGDPENRIVMVGNPTETSGTFYEAFKHPEVWHCIAISCFDHPNVVTGQRLFPGAVSRKWVEEARSMWGEGHPFWYSRVLGQFPAFSDKGVIPLAWAERAQEQEDRRKKMIHDAKTSERLAPIIAVDVARYGQCKCVMGLRWGDAVESIEVWDHTSTMETTGRIVRLWRETQASMVFVDESGVGGGVVDRLMEQNEVPVFGYNSGHRAYTPGQYSNRRSELWWLVRTRLEKDRLLYPKTPQLVADLVAPTYVVKSSGRISIETKEQLLEAGKKSPDFADMLVMLFADSDPVSFEEELKAELLVQDEEAFLQEHLIEPVSPFPHLPAGF